MLLNSNFALEAKGLWGQRLRPGGAGCLTEIVGEHTFLKACDLIAIDD
jgi:hypothetical protein